MALTPQALADIQESGGLTSDIISEYFRGLSAYNIPTGAFSETQPSDFYGQSEEEVSAYYDKDMEMLNKSITLAKKQMEEAKKLSEEQQAKTEQRTYANEDRQFADLLDSAQKGFAGRGTFTSGFRAGAMEEQGIDRASNLEAVQEGFGNTTANRNLTYSKFLEDTAFKEETGKLSIDRARDKAKRENAMAIQSQYENQRDALTTQGNSGGWSKFITSGGVG